MVRITIITGLAKVKRFLDATGCHSQMLQLLKDIH